MEGAGSRVTAARDETTHSLEALILVGSADHLETIVSSDLATARSLDQATIVSVVTTTETGTTEAVALLAKVEATHSRRVGAIMLSRGQVPGHRSKVRVEEVGFRQSQTRSARVVQAIHFRRVHPRVVGLPANLTPSLASQIHSVVEEILIHLVPTTVSTPSLDVQPTWLRRQK